MAWTFGSYGVVICRRCTSEIRPAGWRKKTSTRAEPRNASIAAEPVSPEVAPTMVTRAPRRASTASNMRPTSCSATSLKASVGPWWSSRIQSFGPSCISGQRAGWSKAA